MKTMNLGHERNPVAIGQTIKNLFLVFTGGATLAMTLIAVQPLSHFPRYKMEPAASFLPPKNEPSNNNQPNKRPAALATAAKPPGETPPKEEMAVHKAIPEIRKTIAFHPGAAQLRATAAMNTFLKANALRNDSIVKELAQVIDMHECRFGRASAEPVNDGLMDQLDSSVAKCLQSPAAWHKIIVLGFTDSRGGRLKNIQLGMERAEKLKALLVGKGIPADRITTASFGASLPIDSNDTENGRARNRRAELNTLGNAASAGL